MTPQVGRACEGALLQHLQPSADEAAVRRLAHTDDAVDPTLDQVDEPVALADVKSDAGMVLKEARQAGEQEALGEGAVDVGAEPTRRSGLCYPRLGVVDVRRNCETAPIVILPLRPKVSPVGWS